MAAPSFETLTLKNKTGKLFEFMYDYKMYYLQPDQEWSMDKATGQILANKYFDQLDIVDEGQPLSFPPTEDPNAKKTYEDMNPKKYRSRNEKEKPWCVTCGETFKSSGQLMIHRKKHEKEQRLAKKKEEAEQAVEA